jgi:NAD+ diphosphatase
LRGVKPGFTGAGLDRADHLRLDPAALAVALDHAEARLLGMAGLDPMVDDEARLVWGAVAGDPARLLFLGFDAGAPLFAPLVEAEPVGARPAHLFRIMAAMDAREAAIWGAARALNEWHNRHRFCGQCGAASTPYRAGWGRRCAGCEAEMFPRVDPVVIMLAEHRGRVLVGRQHGWPPGRYSALAGFVEPGESIEEAVARELHEEAGVRVGDVRYVASQPWPFPSQLMIAYIAQAEDDRLSLDTKEIEDALWVDRAGVAAALAGKVAAPFLAPPPFAIAHTLLGRWTREG